MPKHKKVPRPQRSTAGAAGVTDHIEALALTVLQRRGVQVVRRDLGNVEVNGDGVLGLASEVTLARVGWQRTACILKVASHVYALVKAGHRATKRDIYYMDTSLFGKQAATDAAVDDLACTFGTTRADLHVGSTAKGLVVGDVRFKVNGRAVDVRTSPRGAIIELGDFTAFQTPARCVVVVEKDATLLRLIDDDAPRRLNCVLVTGRGFPCIATRRFVRALHDALPMLPMYTLCDADPYGVYIAATYTLGSVSLCHENHALAVPSLRWLGMTLDDADAHAVPADALLPMSPADAARAGSLLAHPAISRARPAWVRHIRALLERGVKAEIQALQARGLDYITGTYLPLKLGVPA